MGAAAPTFGRPRSPPGNGKQWLLHPALPLDVRLVGGLAAASAASYWYFSQRRADEESARQLAAQSERDLDAREGEGKSIIARLCLMLYTSSVVIEGDRRRGANCGRQIVVARALSVSLWCVVGVSAMFCV